MDPDLWQSPFSLGNHVWDDNNLAKKNISIVGTDAGTDFAIATVIGNEDNPADHLLLEVNRGRLPRDIELYVDLLDRALRRRLRNFEHASERGPLHGEAERAGGAVLTASVATATSRASSFETRFARLWRLQPRRRAWHIGWRDGRELVFLRAQPRVEVPV